MAGQGLSIAASKLASLGLAAKLSVGATLVTAGVAGAGAAGVLPDQVNERARDAIEAVTPVNFEDHADDQGDNHGDNFGSVVSQDATGASDGEHGVDGSEISSLAPGAAHRPDAHGQVPADAGRPDDAGMDAGSAPDTAPSTIPDARAGAPDAPTSTVPEIGGPADPAAGMGGRPG